MNIDLELLEQSIRGTFNNGLSDLEILLMAQAAIVTKIVKELQK